MTAAQQPQPSPWLQGRVHLITYCLTSTRRSRHTCNARCASDGCRLSNIACVVRQPLPLVPKALASVLSTEVDILPAGVTTRHRTISESQTTRRTSQRFVFRSGRRHAMAYALYILINTQLQHDWYVALRDGISHFPGQLLVLQRINYLHRCAKTHCSARHTAPFFIRIRACVFVCLYASVFVCDFCRTMLCISATYSVMRCVCVCLCVCLSRSWIMSKEINISSNFFHHRVDPPF